MNEQILKDVYAKAIGDLTLRYLESLHHKDIIPATESNALDIIAQIKAVLDDETLNDPECFRKIDAIVDIFHANGLDAARHDW